MRATWLQAVAAPIDTEVEQRPLSDYDALLTRPPCRALRGQPTTMVAMAGPKAAPRR